LRSADGIYFTKAGARKLAHYVEREIDRGEANRAIPVALPITIEPAPAGAKPGGPSARPLVGPVIPLTAATTAGPAGSSASEELLGGARPAAWSLAADPLPHAYSPKESRPWLQPAVPMISAGRAKAPPRSVPSRYSRRWRLSPSSPAIEEEHQAHTPSNPVIVEA
jgi:hypothetical protein